MNSNQSDLNEILRRVIDQQGAGAFPERPNLQAVTNLGGFVTNLRPDEIDLGEMFRGKFKERQENKVNWRKEGF